MAATVIDAAQRECDSKLMGRVVEIATEHVHRGGKPFACVIANSKTGEILAEASNEVLKTGSPIDHAEIVAIRAASAKLKDVKRPLDGTNGGLGEDFAGFTIYLLTAPCPMCMAAMHLCGPDALVYGTTRDEYGSFFRTDRRYFKLESFYSEVGRPIDDPARAMPARRADGEACLGVYKAWQERDAAAAAAKKAAAAAGPAPAADGAAASGGAGAAAAAPAASSASSCSHGHAHAHGHAASAAGGAAVSRCPMLAATAAAIASAPGSRSTAASTSGAGAVAVTPLAAGTGDVAVAAPTIPTVRSASGSVLADYARTGPAGGPAFSPAQVQAATPASAAAVPPAALGAVGAQACSPAAASLPVILPVDGADVSTRRAEVIVPGVPMPAPAWGDAAVNAAILQARVDEWPRMIEILAHKGDQRGAFYAAMRALNTASRDSYAAMIAAVGRNIYPLIVATDYEPGFTGQGGLFTLYLEDGSARRISPAPPAYEALKGLAHMTVGLASILGPYLRAPRAAGWRAPLSGFLAKVVEAEAEAAEAGDDPAHGGLDAAMRAHALKMLGAVRRFCEGRLAARECTVEQLTAFTGAMLPDLQTAIINAARLQAHAALPELRKWKEELGPALWREVHVLIPTVWPVSEINPRQQVLAQLMDPDRVRTHIIKAEGAHSVEEARTTLGRVVGDRTLAALVFSDRTPDERGMVCALSTPRDFLSSACEDAIALHEAIQAQKGGVSVPAGSPVATVAAAAAAGAAGGAASI